jgi:hypothetical protein
MHTNFDVIRALTTEHLARCEREAASERHARLAFDATSGDRPARGSRRRVASLIAVALAAAIGAGTGAYQAFAANGAHSRAPISGRVEPAPWRTGSNLNPTGSCSGLARAGNPFPC